MEPTLTTNDEVLTAACTAARSFATALIGGRWPDDSSMRTALAARLVLEYVWLFFHVADRALFRKLGDSPRRSAVRNEMLKKALENLVPNGLSGDLEADFRRYFVDALNVRGSAYASCPGLVTNLASPAREEGVFGCFGELVYLLIMRPPSDLIAVTPHRCYATMADAIDGGETNGTTGWTEYTASRKLGFQAGVEIAELANNIG
jgi:hypothetical protein